MSLEIAAGEIHALLGQNGSGKSTLIKILSGYYTPDSGTIAIRGVKLKPPLASDELRRLGVSFVHQDLGLVDTMSVLDNLRVGRYATAFGGRIPWRRERERARALLRPFGLDVDPRVPVGRLSRTEKAIVAIARALQDFHEREGGGLLVLDEPTASLPEHEVDRLFAAVRRAKEEGSSVLFVSHRLEEALEISDRVSVLREGRLVATRPTAELDQRSLVASILGRDLGELYPDDELEPAAPLLEVRGLSGAVARDVSFQLRESEILGLTGLVGAGHDEVPYVVVGAQPALSGEVAVRGRTLRPRTPRAAVDAGIAFLPADRQRLAGTPRATVRENVTLPTLRSYRRLRGLDRGRERREAKGVLDRLGVHPRNPERLLAQLSGGNQQKALLGRWLKMRPSVLLLHEPTQGVDVGARQAIFRILQDTAAEGASILYSSAEYEDLAHLCNRVLVFRRGRVVRELAGAGLTHDAIVDACYHTLEPAVQIDSAAG